MALKGSANFGPRGSTALGFGGHAHRAFPISKSTESHNSSMRIIKELQRNIVPYCNSFCIKTISVWKIQWSNLPPTVIFVIWAISAIAFIVELPVMPRIRIAAIIGAAKYAVGWLAFPLLGEIIQDGCADQYIKESHSRNILRLHYSMIRAASVSAVWRMVTSGNLSVAAL